MSYDQDCGAVRDSIAVAPEPFEVAPFKRQSKRVEALPIVLRVHSGAGTPDLFTLGTRTCVIGSSGAGDIVLCSDTVARRHAALRATPLGVEVVALSSAQGLYHRGRRFRRMLLSPGSSFRAGEVELSIELGGAGCGQNTPSHRDCYGELKGGSSTMRALFSQLLRLESSLASVLIRGESGTGKELIANAIHSHSAVSKGPLVIVNCGALQRELVRSELFGHERGAFTGAIRRRDGAFAAAHGGTLFLDEIAELPLDVQPMLLRALESGSITRVGSHAEERVKVRLIAATHRDLMAEVQARRFRQDLYYRIRVIELLVPPLRERREDIPILAADFVCGQGAWQRRSEVIEALAACSKYQWPGNVRELRNAVEAYLAIGALPVNTSPPVQAPELHLQGQALAEFIDPARPYAIQKEELVRVFARCYLERLLDSTAGNQTEAARISGLQRTYLVKLIGRLGLRSQGRVSEPPGNPGGNQTV